MSAPRKTGDGLEDAHKGRSNRATGEDDASDLGRGHGFGPKSSGPGHDARDSASSARDDAEEADAARDYGRLAASREGRGPETGPGLENEVYPRGSVGKQGYGRRSRAYESTKKPTGQSAGQTQKRDSGEDFDDEEVR
jgi:hypothetical protein